MTPEELERERKASMERRRKQLEQSRGPQPAADATPPRGLTRAERKKLQEDEYVLPRD